MKNLSELVVAALIVAAAIVWHSFGQRYQGVQANDHGIYIVDRLTGKMRLCANTKNAYAHSGYACLADFSGDWDDAKLREWLRKQNLERQ